MHHSASSRDNLLGSLYMILAMAGFVSSDTCIKLIDNEIPVSQIIVLRSLFIIPLLLTIGYWKRQLLPARRAFDKNIILRGVCEVLATMMFLTALTRMPFANAAAIMQAMPLLVIAGAAIFFSEQIGWRRMLAIGIGAIGVLLVIQPGLEGFNVFAILVVGAAVTASARDLITRTIPKDVPTLFITIVTFCVVSIGAFVLSIFEDWQPMSGSLWVLTITSGILITVGFMTIVLAMRTGEINFVTPYRYTALLFAVVYGIFVFGEIPNNLAIIGSVVIVVAGHYSFFRERKLKTLEDQKAG